MPESFKSEPNDLIQPLYDLLLNLATLHNTSETTDPASWSAISCSALLGLCVACGDTGKTLKAIAAILMSPMPGQYIQVHPFFDQNISNIHLNKTFFVFNIVANGCVISAK